VLDDLQKSFQAYDPMIILQVTSPRLYMKAVVKYDIFFSESPRENMSYSSVGGSLYAVYTFFFTK